MSADQYHSLCNELYERIRQKMELRNDDALRFSPRGTASEVLGDDALQSFYDTIEPQVSLAISEEDFIRNIHTKSLHDFLAALIFASCSYEAAVAFATSVVPTTDRDKEDCGGRTSSLPVDRRYLEKIFRDIADVDRFLSKQPCFCAVVLRRGQEITFKGPAMQRLPYIHESLRGTGDFGKVYSVKIAKGHFHYGLQDRGHNAEVIELARKDYMKSEDFINAKSERDIMKQILQSRPSKCENILESYGSIEFGETYSLFMPLAIADLKQYMIEYHPLRPSTMKAKADIVRCALGLAQGLDFLHTKMKTPNFEDMICYHMDLKPSNILIFPSQTDEGYIWKLSDFGMSKVIVRQRGETIEEEKDFDSWFLRRKQPVKDASPSGVQNRRGDGTYFAPESIENSRSMGTKSDVWSLGCVISIVMTYLEGGKDKVLEYEMKRLQHAAAGGLDQFFVRSRFQHATLHPVVNGWHDDLIQDAQQRNRHEGRAVQTILHMLRESAFNISPKERCTAARIVSTLERACLSYREAISISDSTPVPQAGKPDKSWPWTSLKVWNKRRSR
jgi:serine/threonine protein kinase